MGPHKGREKLRPGWDPNPRPWDFGYRSSTAKLQGENASGPLLLLEILFHGIEASSNIKGYS